MTEPIAIEAGVPGVNRGIEIIQSTADRRVIVKSMFRAGAAMGWRTLVGLDGRKGSAWEEDLMSVVVNADACVGAGQCALVAPNVFDQDDDGIVEVLEHNPQGADLDAATRATRLCPARAISLAG